MTAVPGQATSAVRLYAEGLHAARAGRPSRLRVRREDGRCAPLALDAWYAARIPGDEGLLRRCGGPTLDLGCGPGRLAAALAARGVPVLAVDVTGSAVASARRRGVAALRRSVFDRLPAEGRWHRVLLADGNVGIGGDPGWLLRRCARLLGPRGLALVELDADPDLGPLRVRLEAGDRHSEWVDWARVGLAGAATVAAGAGMRIHETWTEEGRCFAAFGAA